MEIKFTRFQKTLEIIGLLLIIGMIIFVCVRYNQLPEQIPGHYNAKGEINRWGNKSEIFIVPIVSTLLYAFITIITFFPEAWNIPIKITDKNKEAVYCCVRNFIIFTKIEMLGMFFYITFFMAYSKPIPASFTSIILVTLFGTITFFVIRTIQIGKLKK